MKQFFFFAVCFLVCTSTVNGLNCTINFVLEEDELYEYLESLVIDLVKYTQIKSITVTKQCVNGTIIEDTFEFDYLMWDFRYSLYEEYVDPIEECQCEETISRYEACLDDLVSEMTTAFHNLDVEIKGVVKNIADNVNTQCL